MAVIISRTSTILSPSLTTSSYFSPSVQYASGWIPKGPCYLLLFFDHHPFATIIVSLLTSTQQSRYYSVNLSDAYALELYTTSPYQTFSYRVNIGRGHASLHSQKFKIKLRSSSRYSLSLTWCVMLSEPEGGLLHRPTGVVQTEDAFHYESSFLL